MPSNLLSFDGDLSLDLVPKIFNPVPEGIRFSIGGFIFCYILEGESLENSNFFPLIDFYPLIDISH